MRRRRFELQVSCLALLLATFLCGASRAAENYPYRASLFYGIGGSIDDPYSKSFDHSSFQLGFSWNSDVDILAGVRYGKLDFGDETGPGGRVGADLTYATVGGEYLFNEGYYKSGVYLGLGWYDLGADRTGAIGSDSGVGLALGLTGDFRLTERFSILVELSAHYTQLEDADLLAMGHAGVAFRF